jgi:hypothetical protein
MSIFPTYDSKSWAYQMSFCTIFKEKPREPPICMHPRGATISVCEHVLRDAYDKKITIIKVGETYVMSIKIRQFGLKNWNIQFPQHNQKNQNIQFEKSNVLVFPDIPY